MENNLLYLKELDILFVEDDKIMLEQTTNTLNIFFKNVHTSTNAKEAYEKYQDKKPDIVLSDMKLDGDSGFDLIRKIRKNDYNTPVIFLTSYSDKDYLLEAVNLGIDGYIVKPLELNKLLDTMSKALKRGTPSKSIVTIAKELIYNYSTKELYNGGDLIIIGKKEQQLLKLFIDNSGKTLSKEEIISHLWPLDDVTDSALKNLLSRLRKKVGEDVICSIKGLGWRINSKI